MVTGGRSGSTALSDALHAHPSVLSVSEWFACLGGPFAFQLAALDGATFVDQVSTPLASHSWMIERHAEPSEFSYRFGERSRFSRQTGLPPILVVPISRLAPQAADEIFDELCAHMSDQPTRPLGAQHEVAFTWLAQRLSRDVWVERSGGSYAWAPSLCEHFPNARFIHLHRSSAAVVQSMSRHRGFQLALAGFDAFMATGIHPYLMPGPVVPACPDEEVAALWPDRLDLEELDRRSTPERFGDFWTFMTSQAATALGSLPPDRVLHVAYDALAASPADTLERIAAFIGIEPGSSWLQLAAATFEPRPPKGVADELVRACAPGDEVIRALVNQA